MCNDITVVVSSCDKYEDAWHPFFEMLRIYGDDFNYPIVLNTESKRYSAPGFNIRVINTSGEKTWSQRMRNVLTQIDSEYIFLLLDDYFLKAPFCHKRFHIALDYMRAHKDVGFMDISPRYAESPEHYQQLTNEQVDDLFYERNNSKFNITLVPSIWRRDFFIEILRDHEDIWSFEYYAGIRAKKAGMKIVRYITQVPTIYEYDFQVWTGMGITRGQWLPKNVEFFSYHNVDVNFDNLGILQVNSLDDIKALNMRSPAVLLKSAKRKIRELINRPKSLN